MEKWNAASLGDNVRMILAETHVDILDSVERDGRGCSGGDTGEEGAPTDDAEATQLERHRQKLQASQSKRQHPVARYRPAGIADVEPLPSSPRVSSRPCYSFQLNSAIADGPT